MFSKLTESLGKVFDKLTSTGYLREEDIDSAMREIRIALIEADVALPVIKYLIAKIKEEASGEKVVKSVSPGQMVIKIVQDSIEEILTLENHDLNLSVAPPAVILMAGLQGSGKTTTTAKLALKLKKEGKKVLIASLDVYRPAAQKQLQVLAEQNDIDVLETIEKQKPLDITKRALKESKFHDVLILDTAGRQHVDEALMQELKDVKKLSKPVETMLVADAITGQDSVNIAQEFNSNVGITGIILTRVDSDARGGAALSMSYIAKCPVKFLATGEKVEDFENFAPDRIASRILGMGDVVSLVEKAQETADKESSEKLMKKLEKGQFDMDSLADQLKGLKKMGGLSGVMKMIPGINKLTKGMNSDAMAFVSANREYILGEFSEETGAYYDVEAYQWDIEHDQH
ncbi:MAG: signal recognition particle protein Srp54, partial [Alphaproteobacteria bacterium]|nr:signal recognition particle protein Srp54 [Alphaproteobacteria bacterium]